jgi:hypothetical protein
MLKEIDSSGNLTFFEPRQPDYQIKSKLRVTITGSVKIGKIYEKLTSARSSYLTCRTKGLESI